MITICILTYGDYSHIFLPSLKAILDFAPNYQVIVGLNAVSKETKRGLKLLLTDNIKIIESKENIWKCSMMCKMIEQVNTPYFFWFDDDYYPLNGCFEYYLSSAQSSPAVLFGSKYFLRPNRDIKKSFLLASNEWADLHNHYLHLQKTNERIYFITGGFWMMRTDICRELNWPPDIYGPICDDIILSQLLLRRGYCFKNIPSIDLLVKKHPVASRQWIKR